MDYKKVKSENMPKLSKTVIAKMAKDQCYLYKIVWAVINGCEYFTSEEGKGLAVAFPGKFHNARWITLCNQVLRLYCSTKSFDPDLQRLVEFLVNVYAPVWFNVVQNSSWMVRGASTAW